MRSETVTNARWTKYKRIICRWFESVSFELSNDSYIESNAEGVTPHTQDTLSKDI